MGKGLRVIFLSSLLITVAVQSLFAASLKIAISQANQPWSVTIGQIDFTGSGGSDFGETQSDADEKTMDIKNPVGSWTVVVKKTDTTWDADIHLFIQRTGNGSGAGPFGPGLNVYQEVTDTDTEFFTGSGGTNNVPLQFKLGGSYASLGVSTGTYTTTITYTITDSG